MGLSFFLNQIHASCVWTKIGESNPSISPPTRIFRFSIHHSFFSKLNFRWVGFGRFTKLTQTSIVTHTYIWIARKFMRRGISVWLDVPVEALAQRITAVGTDSRPLLHSEAGNAYMEVNDFSSMIRVFLLFYAKYK